MRRFWRIFRLLALLSIVVAAIAVLAVTGGKPAPVHLMIATALGAGFTVLLGSALMALAFLSANSGHDDVATPHVREETNEE